MEFMLSAAIVILPALVVARLFTHSITVNWAGTAGQTPVESNNSFTAGHEANLSEAIASDADDVELIYALDVSEAKSFFMMADQDITIYTNAASGGAPDDTIALKAGIPYKYHTDNYDAFKLATDVTSIFVINNSAPATATVLEIRAVVDPTP